MSRHYFTSLKKRPKYILEKRQGLNHLQKLKNRYLVSLLNEEMCNAKAQGNI